MAKIDSTRLRVIISRDIELLLAFIDGLPYKIEIKGGPVIKQKQWHVFYVLPDEENPALARVPLLINLD